MRPPAQALTLVFVCPAALIDLRMVQAKRDPLRAAHARVQKKHRWANQFLVVQRPHSTTSLIRGSMVAQSASANFPAALQSAMRCWHTANMRTITAASAISKHSALPAPAPLRSAPFPSLQPIRSSLSVAKSRTHDRAPSPRTPPPRPALPPPRRPMSAEIKRAHSPFVF
jgi:hypothetical protein